ncbi:MAG: YceI family protein [Magnetococcales bacterium]|nr:YceI family protein [Magnetococcales bacterium]
MLLCPLPADAQVYDIDPDHSSIHFVISHLGYSMIRGRFNSFHGRFEYDEKNPEAANTQVVVDTKSIDTNHAKRDIHLRSVEFLDVSHFPTATFQSVSFKQTSDKEGIITGNLTLHGITRPMDVRVTIIGSGPDPWGGQRRGYEGKMSINRSDFGMTKNIGSSSETLIVELAIEGVVRR